MKYLAYAFIIIAFFFVAITVGAQTAVRVFTSEQVGTNPVNGYCLTTNGATSTWAPCTTGGSGTPGGGNLQLQFNDNGTFGGTSTPSVTAINSTSTTATSTLANIIVQKLQALTSAGLTFFSNSGTPIADFGAGGGSNASFLGGVNIDGQTRLATSLNGLAVLTNGVVSATATPPNFGTVYLASSSPSFGLNQLTYVTGAGTVAGTSSPVVGSITATSTATSTLPFLQSTRFNATTVCILGDCRTKWPIGNLTTVLVAANDASADDKARADYVADGTADNVEIQAAIDAVRTAGGTVMLSRGTFNLAATLNFLGNDSADGVNINFRGQGNETTKLQGATNTDVIMLADVVKVNMSNFQVLPLGTADGIYARAETTGTYRSFWNSSFRNIMVRGDFNTHTGWAWNLENPFRSTFDNLEGLGIGNGIRLASGNPNFNPGNVTFNRVMMDLSQPNGTGLFLDTIEGGGQFNISTFNQFDTIDSETTSTSSFGIRFKGSTTTYHATKNIYIRSANVENFNTSIAFEHSIQNHVEANYVDVKNNGTLLKFSSDSSGNDVTILSGYVDAGQTHHLVNDANTNGNSPNTIRRYEAYVEGTLNATTTSATVMDRLVPAGPGTIDSDIKIGKTVFTADVEVPDEAYGVGWNGSTEVPTKNALWDKIETIGGGSGTVYLASSSPWTVGNAAFVTSNGALGSVATGTLTEGVTGLELSATRGLFGGSAVLNLTSGYVIPTTTLWTQVADFYQTPSTRITTGTGLSWSGNTLFSPFNGTIGTSSALSTGQLLFATGVSTTATVATGTLSSNSASLSVTAGRSVIGGAAAVDVASGFTIPTSTGLASLYTNSHAAITLSGAPDYITLVGQDIVRGAIDLATDITGILADDNGGTGQSTYATGDMLYASSANTLAKRAIGTTGDVLSVVGGVPTWVATSTLGISGGGGGFSDPLTTNGDIIARVSGVTTRLPQGGNGTFLGVSGGTLGYYTPAGSGTINSGTNGQAAFYDGSGTTVSGTSTLFFSNQNVGIGTTTPLTKIAVNGNASFGSDVNSTRLTSNSGPRTLSVIDGNAVARIWRFTPNSGAAATVEFGLGNNDDIANASNKFWDFGLQGNSPDPELFSIRRRTGGSVVNYLAVDATGDVGISTTTQTARLSVVGAAASTIAEFFTSAGTLVMSVIDRLVTITGDLKVTGQMTVGTTTYYGATTSAALFALGPINSGFWTEEFCTTAAGQTTQITADSATPACGRWAYLEDANGVVDFVKPTTATTSYFRLRPGATGAGVAAGDGIGLGFLGAVFTANNLFTKTPQMEWVWRQDALAAATSSFVVGGITNQVGINADFAAEPTVGFYVYASSTPNWLFACNPQTGGTTFVNTGIATSSFATGASNPFVHFRIETSGTAATAVSAILKAATSTGGMRDVAACGPQDMNATTNMAGAIGIGKSLANTGTSPELHVTWAKLWYNATPF